MKSFLVVILLTVVVFAEVAHVVADPQLFVPSVTSVVADAPLQLTATAPSSPSLLRLAQPIEVAEPIVLPEDLEERQDTVVRQTSSSGKLQHILRAHYVGQLDNEQRFETQDASESVALPNTPRVSLNELFFAPPAVPAPLPAAPAPAIPYWPYPSYGYPGAVYPPYGLIQGQAAPLSSPIAIQAQQ